jgi:malate dehydrogenase (oxaloacetate-decarboxylating)(NADP+)
MSQNKRGSIRPQEALDYHEHPRPGKFEIEPTKPLSSQRDLALAYSPGVAEPCRAIAADPDDAFRYTNRGNLVAVVSNGSATLGLGNIGALASKPVMEGKAVLFKSLAGVDAFDLELDTSDSELFISCVRALEPTFGGVNLEDIAAPECFYIEEKLREVMEIPVFHDDQHGTAIITGAALTNALLLQGKSFDEIEVVFVGAGAAGLAIARLYEKLGVARDRITLVDVDGVVFKGREVGMNPYLEYFARETDARTLGDAMKGADVLVGVSVGGIVSKEMVRSMAPKPIIFALANPEPEIKYDDVMDARDDAIVATGRSDFPNQVNNVLCFPFMFRGALDVRARAIDDAMKLAAVRALAELAREEVPEVVQLAYQGESLRFGRDYIIPKPFDPRALLRVAPAVALSASERGLARAPLTDVHAYRERLERLQGLSKGFVRELIHKAKRGGPTQRVAFPEGDEDKIIQAAQILLDEEIATPVLMGDPEQIRARARALDLSLKGAEIFDLGADPRHDEMVELYHELRHRKGVTLSQATSDMHHRERYGMVLLKAGRVDGVVSGVTRAYSATARPAFEIIGVREGAGPAAGAFIVVTKQGGVTFFADTTVNVKPKAEDLRDIALATAELARSFDIEPRVALLSHSNFGTSRHPRAQKMARVADLLHRDHPDMIVDGEMQVDPAIDPELRGSRFGFSRLTGEANVLIFPDLDSGNIGYKLLHRLGGAELIGPILLNMNQPVNVLEYECSVPAIVNLATITCIQAHREAKREG